MPINLSKILFENNTSTSEAETEAEAKAAAKQKALKIFIVNNNLRKLTGGDIHNSVSTIADVASGEIESTDPEDLELDRGNKDSEKKTPSEDGAPLDLSDLLNIKPDEEPLEISLKEDSDSTVKEPSNDDSIDDEVEGLLAKMKDPNLQKNLFEKIFLTSEVFDIMNSKKGFRVKVKDKIKDELEDKKTSQGAKNRIEAEERNIAKRYSTFKIAKGEAGSKSGTFTTWCIIDQNDTFAAISVVFALGGNKGHKFEKQAGASVKTKAGPVWEALTEYLKSPRNDPAGKGIPDLGAVLDSYELTNQNRKVRRQFSSVVSDIGSVVSDLTLYVKRENNDITPIYVSLKGKNGKTISNNGYTAIKLIQDRGAVPTDSASMDKDLKAFINTVELDNKLVADGLNAWIKRSSLQRIIQPIPLDKGNAALRYVTPQIGYGYIYLREKKDGRLGLITLRDDKDVQDLVGEFKSGEIKYPYWEQDGKQTSSRQCTIKLTTTKGVYLVEIRNTTGVGDENREKAAVSLQCNMRVESIYGTEELNETVSGRVQGLLGSLLWPRHQRR